MWVLILLGIQVIFIVTHLCQDSVDNLFFSYCYCFVPTAGKDYTILESKKPTVKRQKKEITILINIVNSLFVLFQCISCTPACILCTNDWTAAMASISIFFVYACNITNSSYYRNLKGKQRPWELLCMSSWICLMMRLIFTGCLSNLWNVWTNQLPN